MPTNGWKSIQWGVISALVIAILGTGFSMWQKFSLMEERQAYLMTLNEQQNKLLDVMKDSIQDLQKQIAMNAQTDDAQRDRLMEHDSFFREMFRRLRAVEQATHPEKE